MSLGIFRQDGDHLVAVFSVEFRGLPAHGVQMDVWLSSPTCSVLNWYRDWRMRSISFDAVEWFIGGSFGWIGCRGLEELIPLYQKPPSVSRGREARRAFFRTRIALVFGRVGLGDLLRRLWKKGRPRLSLSIGMYGSV